MIATIPLATGNKLNCFISAKRMLTILWHCALVLPFFVVFCVFFVHHVNTCKSSSQKKEKEFFVTITRQNSSICIL